MISNILQEILSKQRKSLSSGIINLNWSYTAGECVGIKKTHWMCVDYTGKHVQSFIWSKAFSWIFHVTFMPWKRRKRSNVSVCSVSQQQMNMFDTNIFKCIASKFLAMTWNWYFDLYFSKWKIFVWKNNIYDITKFSCTSFLFVSSFFIHLSYSI